MGAVVPRVSPLEPRSRPRLAHSSHYPRGNSWIDRVLDRALTGHSSSRSLRRGLYPAISSYPARSELRSARSKPDPSQQRPRHRQPPWSAGTPVLELFLSPLAIFFGCVLLYLGGDMLVSASTFIADRIGMSPVAIGATVVALGTSAPELSVSLDAALSGHSDVSVGNIVGSNVCNIILVLGLCGLFTRLRPSREILRLDFPILILVSAIFTWMISDQLISRVEGIIFLLALVAYVAWNLRRVTVHAEIEELLTDEATEALGEDRENWLKPAARAIGGIFFLALGAKLLVTGSLRALEGFALSEAAIGLTIVALGTSVPEIGTSIIAARKGHADLAVGNAIGSSVFNLLGVLGLTASIKPLQASDVTLIDGSILIAVSITGLVLMARPGGIGRVQGAILVSVYSLYVIAALVF
jgi:cation:H+ antiporter